MINIGDEVICISSFSHASAKMEIHAGEIFTVEGIKECTCGQVYFSFNYINSGSVKIGPCCECKVMLDGGDFFWFRSQRFVKINKIAIEALLASTEKIEI